MLNQLKLQVISQGTHFHLEIVQYCAAEHSACTENLLPIETKNILVVKKEALPICLI